MSPMLRRASIGILAGAVAGTALVMTVTHPLPVLVITALVGAGYSASLNPTKGTYVDNLMAGAALGIPLWALISVVAIPVVAGRQPEWNSEQIRGHFPAVVGWVIYGAVLGLLTQGLND